MHAYRYTLIKADFLEGMPLPLYLLPNHAPGFSLIKPLRKTVDRGYTVEFWRLHQQGEYYCDDGIIQI